MAANCGLTIHQADRMQTRWFQAHPGIQSWHTRTETLLRDKHCVTNKFGYRRFYFDRIESLLPEALAWLKKADALSPLQADVTNALVHVCGQLGLKDEAAFYKQRLDEIKKRDETLDRLVSEAKIRPDDPEIRFQLAITCLKYGRDEEASHWFQGILRKNPNHLPTLKALADYYDKKGNHKLASHYRRKAEKAGGQGSAKAPSSRPAASN